MTIARRWNIAFTLAMLTLVGASSIYSYYHVSPVRLARPLWMFPAHFDGWTGQAADPRLSPLRLRNADDELIRVYRNSSGDSIGLYIGYFNDQRGDKKLVDFRSKDLARGADEVEVFDGASSSSVGRTVLTHGGQRQLVFYWFDINGRIVPSRYMAKFYMLEDAVWKRGANGALVLVFLDSTATGRAPGDSPHELTFVRSLLPMVRSYLVSQS